MLTKLLDDALYAAIKTAPFQDVPVNHKKVLLTNIGNFYYYLYKKNMNPP